MAEEMHSTAFEHQRDRPERYRAPGHVRRSQRPSWHPTEIALRVASLAMTALLLWILYRCLDGVAQCIVRAVELLNRA